METKKWKFVHIFVGLCICLSMTDLGSSREIILNKLRDVFSSGNLTENDTDVQWHLKLYRDICQIDLKILHISSTDECNNFVAISAGDEFLEGTKTLLTTSRSIGRWVRIANNEAYVIPVSITGNDTSIEYELYYKCTTDVIDGENMTEGEIPFKASPNISIEICLINLSNSTAKKFYENEDDLRMKFLEKVAEAARSRCKTLLSDFETVITENQPTQCTDLIFEAGFNWPIFIQTECEYGRLKYDWKSNYCACFNLSISYFNKHTGEEKYMTADQLKELFRNVNNVIIPANVTIEIIVPIPYNIVPLIITSALIIVICFATCSGIYWRTYTSANRLRFSDLKFTESPRTSELSVQMVPTYVTNVIYDPNYDDSVLVIPPTIHEEEDEEEEENGGIDNPAFVPEVTDFSPAMKLNNKPLRGPVNVSNINSGSQRSHKQLITFVDTNENATRLRKNSESAESNDYAELDDFDDSEGETKL